jgi:omega-amidase
LGAHTETDSRPRVAAFQFDVRRGEVQANLARVEEGLREAASRGISLVVLPEMWPTSFVDLEEFDARWLPETQAALEHVSNLSAELDLMVAGSSFAPGDLGQRPRNRLLLVDRGEELIAYDKVHLFTPTAEAEAFSAGDKEPPTVDTRLGKISCGLCYDLRFPWLFRGSYLSGAEIIVLPAQWPATRAPHWSGLVTGRAVECQAYVIACNRTGVDHIGRRRLELSFPGNSFLVGPHGDVLAAGTGAEGLVEAQLDMDGMRRLRRQVPVRRDDRADLYSAWSEIRES